MNRREFFTLAAGGVAAANTAHASIDIADPCQYHVERLREELEKRHGKKWLVEVNHERGTVFGWQLSPTPHDDVS